MRLDNLDLNLLVALEAIFRLQSVSAAAEEMALTQPALSRSLAKLRHHFEDELVVQIGRQMVPTDFGAQLAELLGNLLNEAKAFSQIRPGFDASTARREFTIAASDYAVSILLTHVMRHVANAAPQISLRVLSIDATTEQVFDRGGIDFRICTKEALAPDHPHEELFRDEYVCAVWDQNPEVGKTLDKETYLRLRHVTCSFGVAAKLSHFEMAIRGNKLSSPGSIYVPSLLLLPEFVIGTPLIATIQKRLLSKIPADAPFRFFPPPIPVDPLVEHLQWHRARHHDMAAKWLRQVIADAARKHLKN